MPNPNTNKLKKYIKQYEEIEEYYDEENIEDMDGYLQECADIEGLESYYDNVSSEINKIDKFTSELNLVLDTIGLLKEEKYTTMLDKVKDIRSEYSDQISLMEPCIKESNCGY
ncbi:MAG: hypothetical protein LLF98_15290 [Clostridium sp.]|uniref:hypothetical protein n=1 Tax=Clostridium sp. TaxID=1506 RepID=UPI0025BB3824|nr:hypothetical protein [Clostridium sp.]MCE5222550.1 hypothetical protein [Clostridium sp.]